MAAAVGKMAAPMAKKFLNDEASKYSGAGTDPYYEYRVVNGKMTKVKKDIPDFIPEHDAKILARAQKRAHRLDKCWSFCGFRWGVSSIWGLLPEVGDIIDIFMAIRLAFYCNKIKGGLPFSCKLWIFFIICVDFFAGLFPIVGDLLDTALKANVCTVYTLERHLIKIHDPLSSYNAARRKKGLPCPPLPGSAISAPVREKPVSANANKPLPSQPTMAMAMPQRAFRPDGQRADPPPPYSNTSVPVRFNTPAQMQRQQQSRFERYADFSKPVVHLAAPVAQNVRAMAAGHAHKAPPRKGRVDKSQISQPVQLI